MINQWKENLGYSLTNLTINANLIIELSEDDDDYSIVDIQTNGCAGENNRPILDIILNGKLIHAMFETESIQLLEELLGITDRIKKFLDPEDYETWLDIQKQTENLKKWKEV